MHPERIHTAVAKVLHIARGDLRLTFRAWETWLFAFLMPVLFMAFFGAALSAISSGLSAAAGRPLVVVMQDNAGFLGDELLSHLEGLGLRTERVSLPPESGRSLSVPEHFTRSLLTGTPAPVTFNPGEGNPTADLERFQVNRALALVMTDLVVARTSAVADGRPPEAVQASDIARIHAIPRSLTLKLTRAGKRAEIPSGLEQAVPGIMVMFSIISLVSVAGTSLLMERRAGILSRLASAPISPFGIVMGKLAAKWVFGMVQVVTLMVTGRLLFGIHWGSEVPTILIVMSSYVALLACLGLLVGSIARSEGQTIGGGIMLTVLLAALGGCWFPIEISPAWMQQLSVFLPSGLTMSALHHLVSFGDPPTAVLPHILGLLIGTCGLAYLAARNFRFQ